MLKISFLIFWVWTKILKSSFCSTPDSAKVTNRSNPHFSCSCNYSHFDRSEFYINFLIADKASFFCSLTFQLLEIRWFTLPFTSFSDFFSTQNQFFPVFAKEKAQRHGMLRFICIRIRAVINMHSFAFSPFLGRFFPLGHMFFNIFLINSTHLAIFRSDRIREWKRKVNLMSSCVPFYSFYSVAFNCLALLLYGRLCHRECYFYFLGMFHITFCFPEMQSATRQLRWAALQSCLAWYPKCVNNVRSPSGVSITRCVAIIIASVWVFYGFQFLDECFEARVGKCDAGSVARVGAIGYKQALSSCHSSKKQKAEGVSGDSIPRGNNETDIWTIQ